MIIQPIRAVGDRTETLGELGQTKRGVVGSKKELVSIGGVFISDGGSICLIISERERPKIKVASASRSRTSPVLV